MTVYISGGISGIKNYLDKFAKAEEMLLNEGHDVINPARILSQFPVDTEYVEYMTNSLRLLDKCDTIFLMRDWEDSYGARIEFVYSQATGKNIIFESMGKGFK